MHAAEEIVHAEIGHEEREESQDHVKMVVARGAQPGDGTVVDGDSIDHQRDECPRFFRVPAPVGAPRDVGPDGTDEDTKAKAGEGRVEELMGEC